MPATLTSAPSKSPDVKPALNASPRPWLHHATHACNRVPPLWPLHSFVAVNPFVGLADKSFAEVAGLMQRVTHQSMLMSAEYFRKQWAAGRISPQHLAAAIQQQGACVSVEDALAWLASPQAPPLSGMLTVTDLVAKREGERWKLLVTEEVSKWCAAFFDEGQSSWRMPWKQLPLFAAWRKASLLDAAPEWQGLVGFREWVSTLPETGDEALGVLLDHLTPPETLTVDYLHRVLMTLPGWSSYVQYQVRSKTMKGAQDGSLQDLLAILLAFECQLLRQFGGRGLDKAWRASFPTAAAGEVPQVQMQLLWHAALEVGFQEKLCKDIALKAATPGPQKTAKRPALQGVFCIDVRSEVMRRSLEAVSHEIETLGFAGFFGMPVEYVPFGQRHGSSQVPVLLSPKYVVREHLSDASAEEELLVRHQQRIGRRVGHSWNAFKTSAVSCFSFVESAGIGFAWRLVKDGFLSGSRKAEVSHACNSCAMPRLDPPDHAHSSHHVHPAHPDSGIPAADQVQLALGALKNMGLTGSFARLVMLCGHGSHTTNNPYAAGLDCGACGGHSGGPNARVAAALLNQPAVRTGLSAHGIQVPSDTWFVAALHDTTTDNITIFDEDKVPTSHEPDLLQAQLWLAQAGRACRMKRAASLGLAGAQPAELDDLICARSQDWSEVRPEWGLAGNAAFIAAPRERTKELDLKGRVFLHSYRHEADTTKSTLELIMTAPMVVANWINLQYYASTVNNRLWGSGNKTTHNVVGTFGILQGNGGDLQAGLPWQSVHNGETWMHEPVRLSVLIEAPRQDIDAVMARHESVRQLVENGWLHLFAIEQEGRLIVRRTSHGSWIPV